MFEKKLNAFYTDDFNPKNLQRVHEKQLREIISFKDSSEVLSFDENGEQTSGTSITNRYLMGSDVKSYLLKEEWIFNSNSGQSEKYVIALAPLIYNEKQGRVVPLFWLYYPEWKELFASFEAKNFYTSGVISYNDVFLKKFFISQISKENNIFNRSVKSTNHGADAQGQSEGIKDKINNSSGDLFPH